MIRLYKVSGISMEPVFREGEYVLAETLSYLFKNPAIGELVIAESPIDGRKLLKRIVEIRGNSYFLEGDNKVHSADSRDFGAVKKDEILAKVWYNF